MRPQHFAAEYYLERFTDRRGVLGFNEAAALRCGILARRRRTGARLSRFNEAAALRCGIHAHALDVARIAFRASMRPQHFAAEYLSLMVPRNP